VYLSCVNQNYNSAQGAKKNISVITLLMEGHIRDFPCTERVSTSMRLILSNLLLVAWWCSSTANAFSFASIGKNVPTTWLETRSSSSQLCATIGLGPEKKMEEEGGDSATKTSQEEEERELIAGVDYEIPDHESFRLSRRSKLDEECDAWFGALLGGHDDKGILGKLADDAREKLLTPVSLVNDVSGTFSGCFIVKHSFSHFSHELL
jgi:hypothetical protein